MILPIDIQSEFNSTTQASFLYFFFYDRLKKSQADERKLHHALKNPRSFAMNPCIPMFAKDPVVYERNMGVSKNFHMSQVDGAEKKKQRSALNLNYQGQERYRLTEMEERRRFHILGDLTRVCFEEATCQKELLRRFLAARKLAASSRHCEKKRWRTSGKITQMLRTFESLYRDETNDTSFNRPSRSLRKKDGKSLVDALFPLHLSSENSPQDTTFSKVETAANGLFPHHKLDNAESNEITLKSATFPNGWTMRESSATNQSESLQCRTDRENMTTIFSSKVRGTNSHSHESFHRATNPYAKEKATVHFMESSKSDVTPSMEQMESNMESQNLLKSRKNIAVPPDSFSVQPFDAANSTTRDPVDVASSDNPLVDRSILVNNDIFRLPSQDNDDSSSDGSQVYVSHNEKMQTREEDLRHDTICDRKHVVAAAEDNDDAGKDCFRLPTPSSSSDDESDDEHENAARDFKGASGSFSSGSLPKSMSISQSNEDHCQLSADCAKKSQEVYSIEEDDKSPILARGRSAAKRNKPVMAIQDTQDSPSGQSVKNHGVTTNPDHSNTVTTEVRAFVPEKNMEHSENLSVFMSQTSATKVRFSVDSVEGKHGVDYEGENETVDTVVLPRKKAARVKNNRLLAINDTPSSNCDAVASYSETKRAPEKFIDDLRNTQDICLSVDCESTVCAVCFGKESPDFDPIILCDGSNNKTCNFAVHVTCYNANVDLNDENSIWRCDVCQYLQEGGTRIDRQCCLCFGTSGVLKCKTANVWQHVRCDSQNKDPTRLQKLKRLKSKAPKENNEEDTAPTEVSRRRPLTFVSTNIDALQEYETSVSEEFDAEIRKKRRKEFFQKFIDDEAEATDGDEIDDEEEKEMQAIEEEEEELAEGFINDSSQLGYTQDELDFVDPGDDGMVQRALDNERERMRQFATPMMNRLMMRQSDTPASAPDSDKGLGRMHFIRSVLEHHRQGGRAEDIEEVYQQLEKDVNNDAVSERDKDSWDTWR